MAITDGWKGFAYDLSSALLLNVRYGSWAGSTPFTFPQILINGVPFVDSTLKDCGAIGYSYCADIASVLRFVGLWPNGWPSRVFAVSAAADAVERTGNAGNLGAVTVIHGPFPGSLLSLAGAMTIRRSSQVTVTREATTTEMQTALQEISSVFAPYATEMAQQQELWRTAMARPFRNATAIAAHLTEALTARGLSWTVTEYSSLTALLRAAALRPASQRQTWSENARDAALCAVYDRDPDAYHARDFWTRRDRALSSAETFAVAAAFEGMMVYYAAQCGWTGVNPLLLTTGYRDAIEDGLAVALPTGATELGWAMWPT